MNAGPIYYFKGEYAWASNFDDSHSLILGSDCDCVCYPKWLSDANFYEDAQKAGLALDGDGVRVVGVERLFQAFKTDDLEVAVQILAAPTPGKAKSMGRHPDHGGLVADLRSGWDYGAGARGLAQDTMYWLSQGKYLESAHCELLTRTGYRMIVEGNSHRDTRWGAVLMAEVDAKAQGLPIWGREPDGRVLAGWNWLGRILMLIRAEFDCQVEWS